MSTLRRIRTFAQLPEPQTREGLEAGPLPGSRYGQLRGPGSPEIQGKPARRSIVCGQVRLAYLTSYAIPAGARGKTVHSAGVRAGLWTAVALYQQGHSVVCLRIKTGA